MRWRAVAGVCLLAVAISLATGQQQEKEDDQQPQSSIARAQWQDVQNPNQERKEDKGYEEKAEEEGEDQYEQRRVRVRNGPKRRRRLRKRPRTTTPPTGEDEPVQDEQIEEQYPVRPRWSHEDSVDYLPVDGDYRPYRRRPGKRRRRPLRKQQYSEQPEEEQENQDNGEDVYRRRRKGYRKRIRVQEEHSEDGPQEEQQQKKNENNQETTEEPKRTSSDQTHIKPNGRGDAIRQQVTKQPNRHEENTGNVVATRRHHFEASKEGHQTTTVRTRSEETQIHHDDFKQLIKSNRNHERHRDKTRYESNVVGEKKESKNDTASKGSSEHKEKVFDRKALFSTSRRLPQTSAIIRRRLRPKNSTLETLLPKGYNKQMPEIIPPYKLIEEVMSTRKTTTEKDSSEEPNYPKMPEQRTRIVVSTSTSISISPDLDDQNMYTTIEEFFKVGKEPQTSTTTTSTTTTTTVKPDSESEKSDDSLENIDIEDHILDLLLAKNSSSKLAKILELRNMTLIQLLQHRERGSSQLHFSDVFTKNGTSNEKENLGEKNDIAEDKSREIYSNVEQNVRQDIREPRIFESLPDFDTDSLESRTKPYPTWSVIPNPDLTPISVKTNYDGVPITRATIRPLYTDNIEEIILIEDNTVDRFPGSFNMNFANRISDGIKTFKKFPPGVKSAIIVSLGILVLAIIGFLSVLISCRVRQKRSRLRAKRDVLNEQLHNEEFMNSQRSLSPVLSKNQPTQPSFTQGIHSNTSSNRHYYLWRTLRKTFQYD